MKIEPTEARCHIITRSFGNGYGDEIMMREDAEEAVNMAFKEGQSSPKIKQLEWAEGFFALLSDTQFGSYQIFKPISSHNAYIVYLNDKPILIVSDLNEAKSSAQADFEQRIKGCLE